MTELHTSLSCSCGRVVVARAKDAGGSILFSCGNSVSVPNLSELRKFAGTDPFVTNPAEAIRKQQQQGINPAGNLCLLCRSSAPVFYKCRAVCESSQVARIGSEEPDNISLVSALFNPFRAMLFHYLWRKGKRVETRGHDIVVTFQLPVCDPCAATTGKVTRTAVAKRLMLKVPVYEELLKYYPKLQLKIERA